MKKYLFIFIIIIATGSSLHAQSIDSTSITFSPLHLLMPVIEMKAEFSIKEKMSVAAIAGIGNYNDVGIIELGGQYNYYIIGNFRHGLQLGGELQFINVSNSTSDYKGTGNVITAGPYVGYKYISGFYGLTFNAQGGLYVSTGRISSVSGADETGFSFSDSGIILNLNLGWSF